jgi:hypothetical protein
MIDRRRFGKALGTGAAAATPAGIGHSVPQEAPTAFAQAVVDADHL